MSFNLKVVDDDDENDSFHSFVQSEADSFDLELDDLSNFDESDNISDEHEQSDNNVSCKLVIIIHTNLLINFVCTLQLPNIRAVAQASFLAEDDKSASSEPELENSIEPILQAGNQSRPSVESIEEHKVCPINPGLTTSRKYYIDQYMVPEPSGNGSKPAMNLFNMSISNKEDVLDVSANTEALQKYAYTESWIEGQQKGSLRRRLSAALDGLFNKEDANRLGEEQPQENTVRVNQILILKTS